MAFAKITVLGNLGNDPDVKYAANGAMVVSFSLAVNPRPRNGQQGPAVWYRCTAWDRIAERLHSLTEQGHLAKGRTLYVEGAFEPREFDGKDGARRISYDVTITDFQFVGGDRQQDGQDAPRTPRTFEDAPF
jgi:single-strand DNA-binding protein